jgi:hypothetical protein
MKTRALLLPVALALCGHDGVTQEREPGRFRIHGLRLHQAAPNTVRATGNAATKVGDWSIQAELLEVQLDAKTQSVNEVSAEGFVVIERGTDRLHLLRLRLDARTGRGTFELHRPLIP